MSWLIPYPKLDSEQRETIDRILANKGRNFFIKGFAGSGKSIVLLHILIKAKQQNPALRVCVVGYTNSLVDMYNASIPPDIKNVSTSKSINNCGVDAKTYSAFEKSPQTYDMILVDEVQDLSEKVVSLLHSQCHQLIVAGDGAQSIYEHGMPVAAMVSLINAVTIELKILHRLPNKIIEIVKAIFPSNELEKASRSKLRNVDVTLATALDVNEEIKYVFETASSYANSRVSTAILLPQKRFILGFIDAVLNLHNFDEWQVKKKKFGEDFDNLNNYLSKCGLSIQYLGGGYGDLNDTSKVHLLTYHSAKGLDFETVLVPNVCENINIWGRKDIANNLFYVALTRSRINLYLSYTGKPHPYITRIPDNLLRRVELPIKKQVEVATEEELFF
ncbi:DNA helicase [Dulcicalothrix desertica PCC 7102]|uniref:DNA helicase n=1 Tax=Dulcicalothrix desertica PCC 7102 TaxID=232991 RepID=A0A433VD11_9CYAN|nr:3'-5' exonuclease [Dulcicalothrix desertica]RUT03995.1 DNA helicase [Dulcicalothrix desertica PCC 7102]TWH43599.1 Superfamily I DNA and RNA helicases [Dulcicalothrix desertica PCC 7102]